MQTIDEVKKHCREVGEGIVAAVAPKCRAAIPLQRVLIPNVVEKQ